MTPVLPMRTVRPAPTLAGFSKARIQRALPPKAAACGSRRATYVTSAVRFPVRGRATETSTSDWIDEGGPGDGLHPPYLPAYKSQINIVLSVSYVEFLTTKVSPGHLWLRSLPPPGPRRRKLEIRPDFKEFSRDRVYLSIYLFSAE
jgi:hypothetical protein